VEHFAVIDSLLGNIYTESITIRVTSSTG